MRKDILLIILSFSLLSSAAPTYASSMTHERDVTLTGSALGESHYNTCPPLTIFLANRFPHDQTILVDMELRNASGMLVDQEFFDNYTIASTKKGGSVSLMNHCDATLPDGSYTYSVGLFTTGWGGLVHWYDSVASFTVQVNAAPALQLVHIDRPKMNLPSGTSASITPTLINTGPTVSGTTVVVSLWRGGNFIDDITYADQTFAQNAQMSFPFHTIPLMQGSYTIKAVVKDESGSILGDFPDLGTIAVE